MANKDQLHDLIDFMRSVSRGISDEYARIRKTAAEDPGTAGDQGEENWANVLREWLPPTYQIVTKGRILSQDGHLSPQVDVLVLAPSYPLHLRDKKHYLAGGVLAAFECKTTLKAEHLKEACESAVSIRRHIPLRFGTPYRELFSPILYGLLAHSHSWQSQPEKVGDHVLNLLSEHDVTLVKHPREMLDLICVADLGIWVLKKDTWNGPKTINKGSPHAEQFWREVASRTFGQNGCATTEYCRSVLPSTGAVSDPRFTPIGALLSVLLRRMAWEDKSLRGIASYFWDIHMEGGGPGYSRRWGADVYSAPIRADVVEGTHVPAVGPGRTWDNDKLWDEWTSFFL